MCGGVPRPNSHKTYDIFVTLRQKYANFWLPYSETTIYSVCHNLAYHSILPIGRSDREIRLNKIGWTMGALFFGLLLESCGEVKHASPVSGDGRPDGANAKSDGAAGVIEG
jgi:hypothetical protein